MSGCTTCDLLARRDAGAVPLWDSIHRTPFWDVVHSYNTALPGWLVLVVRRHIEAVDELTDDEAVELGLLIKEVSVALREATGCLKTYVMQFAEAQGHPHVHFHIVPRMADQPEARRSTKIFGYLGAPEEDRVSEARMNEIAAQVRRHLRGLSSPPESMNAYQIAELKHGILNLRLDLKGYEEKYHRSTADFYREFNRGQTEDVEDFIVWAGLHEMLETNERRLRELE